MLDASQTSKIEIRQGPRVNPKRRKVQRVHSQKRGAAKAPAQRSGARLEAYRGTRTGRATQARHGQVLTPVVIDGWYSR